MNAAINCVAIAGVGLIGGSIGLAVKKFFSGVHVIGIGRDASRLRVALERGCIDEAALAPSAAAAAQLIVAATPVDQIVEDLSRMAEHAPRAAVLTDAGSTKVQIVRALDALLPPHVRFVGGHPMAGSEKSGAQHAQADLFIKSNVLLTPGLRSDKESTQIVADWWGVLGAQVHLMTPEEHDEVVASISHAPHALAAIIAAATSEQAARFAGPGWKSTCRIAAGDPALWVRIIMANRDPISRELKSIGDQLNALAAAVQAGDGQTIERILAAGRDRAESVLNQQQG